ncbi:transposase family protein [Streptomyces klenkii]|uniref:transposase family protein n=1 Tax=Streptomyces klenkii TaxID=1420899 RepID=UPI001319CCAE
MTLVHLREHITLATLAASFRMSESSAHTCVCSVTVLPAARAPSLTRALRNACPEQRAGERSSARCNREPFSCVWPAGGAVAVC